MKNMDVSSLREQYRNSRDCQRKHTQVLLFNTVSEELSDAVSIIPVTQGLTSSPPDITFIAPLDPTTFDPWHIHLDHHRRSCSGVTAPLPTTCSPHTSVSCSSRRSSSSSSSSPSSSPSSSSSSYDLSDSPCSTREDEHRPSTEPVCASDVDPVSASLDPCQQNSCVWSTAGHAPDALTCADVTPVAFSSPCSSTSALHADLKSQATVLKTRTRTSRSSRQMKIIRQQSVGTEGSSSWVHLNQSKNQSQNQSYYPFPSRKTQRISETARKLGMYSSF
ncbi:uncharacterized protein DDB_G0271670-like [Solea solea]|uniref:uncharacterized protein DDB_G0271670-like n=1 Tax=Solea solea TaxID=90069 RepID=UPI002729FB6B|nr:uncharacterized protein DDB_G0271670-like [Solea solea]